MRIKEILEAVAQGTIPPQAQRKVPQGTGATPNEFGARTMGKGEEVSDIGTRTVYNKDGSSTYDSSDGRVTRNKFGQITQTQTPSIAGVQQTDKYDPGSIGNKPTSQLTNIKTTIGGGKDETGKIQSPMKVDLTMPGPIGKADPSKATDMKLKMGNWTVSKGTSVDKGNTGLSKDFFGHKLDMRKDGSVGFKDKTGKTIQKNPFGDELDQWNHGTDGI